MAYAQTQAPVMNRLFAELLLAALTARPAAALIPTPLIHLIGTPGVSLTPDTLLATLTAAEANFSGYAAATPTLVGPAVTGPSSEGELGSATFIATTASPFVANTVYGYYISDGTDWVVAELFPAPQVVPIAVVGAFLEMDCSIPVELLITL